LGYEVTSIVDTGEKAIQQAEEDKPDLILMDIRIKGEMDGIETAEEIRNRFGIPVIFSTAYLDEERIERAKITMPFGYVLKPIQERDLKVTIEMALYVSKVDAERRKTEEALSDSNKMMQESNIELIKTKNNLIVSEHRYKSLFQNLYNSFSLYEVIFDKNGNPDDYKILDVNPAYEKTVGIQASSVIGKTLLELFPRTEPIWLEIMKRVVQTRIPELIEHYAVEVDKYIEMLVYVPQDGEIAFIAADVTDRKKAEEAQQENGKYLEIAQKMAKLGHWKLNTKTRKVVGSDELFNIFETNTNAFTFETFGSVVHPDDLEYNMQHINRGTEKGEPWDIEYRLLLKDGTIKTIRAIGEPVIDDSGNVVEIIGTIQDITNHKLMEIELKQREALLSKMGEISKIGGWEVDLETMTPTWTDETKKIYDVDEVPPVEEGIKFYSPESLPIVQKAFEKMIVEGESYDLELQLITAKGQHKLVRTIGTPVYNETGKIIKVIGMIQDITEDKKRKN